METSADICFATRGIIKDFSGVKALRGVDLDIRRGEIHAILGQNGAGKSTLVKVINGVYPDGTFEGELHLSGKPLRFRSPRDAADNGVAYVPQEVEILRQLSVAENIFAGRTGRPGSIFVTQRDLRRRARLILDELGVDIDPAAVASSLSAAHMHLVMIARALAMTPEVLILDEPTASLSGHEVKGLFDVLRRLQSRGVTMLYITHRLPEVMAICDRATVLRDGLVAATFERAELDEEAILLAMSGRRIQGIFPHRPPQRAKGTALELVNLQVPDARGRIHPVSFSVGYGEIVGLAGLLGSGRTEILNAVYGRVAARGEIRIDGKPVAVRSPRDARGHGIAFLTEDRKGDGLLFNLPVSANITIGNLQQLSRLCVVDRAAERLAVKREMEQLNVKAPSPQASVAHLSGGNQQKLLFSRVLMGRPRILLLDEPTKGVDAATRQEVYRLVTKLADDGVALLVVASELEEIVGLCDRILVISHGEIVDTFLRGEGGEDRIHRALAADASGARLSAGTA